MSKITKLDETEVENFKKFSEGVGLDAKLTMLDYTDKLSKICQNDFAADDDSSVRATAEALVTELQAIYEAMDNADKMIDSMIDFIKCDIIERENKLASSVLGD